MNKKQLLFYDTIHSRHRPLFPIYCTDSEGQAVTLDCNFGFEGFVRREEGQICCTFLQVLNDLVKKGVEVRLIHAKEPGTAFREDFDKYPALLRPRQGAKAPLHHSLWRYFYRHYPHDFS